MSDDSALPALLGLLDQALDLPTRERAAWLPNLRRQNASMASQVEAMLASEARLDRLGFLTDLPAFPASADSLAGLQIAGYTLERPLGRGGMGTVWMARRTDGRFEGVTAIKLLHLALLDSVGATRFRREGTMLARLSHARIARLLDAGVTATGQPYLVLEYVEGERIDAYCDARRLNVEVRLELFLQVLDGVAHAHAGLVVHRDLKPSNILVTRDGAVKLLDFGIAKLLQEEPADASALTDQGWWALTPEYAAPEQVTGGAITTATDVYALGVLLYVLLAGRHPTADGSRTPNAYLTGILENEPLRLSQAVDSDAALSRGNAADRLRRQYRGDLDRILAKALCKAPQQRYQSVTALRDDLRRYLNREPISARRPSLGYRTSKFVQRNRTSVALASLGVVGLLATTGFSLTQMRVAEQQRDAAVQERRRADAQLEFQHLLMSQVGEAPATMREILDRSRDVLERQYAGDPRSVAALLVDLSQRYAQIGEQQSQGDLLARADSIVVRHPGGVHLATIRCHMGDHQRSLGEYAAARTMFARADSLLRAEPDRHAEIACLHTRARFHQEIREGEESVLAIQRALALEEELGETNRLRHLEMLGTYANALDVAGRQREAIAVHDRLLAGLDSSGRGGQMSRNVVQHDRAIILTLLGQSAQAEREFHEVLRRAMVASAGGRVHPQPLIHYAEAALEQGMADTARKYFGILASQAERDSNRYWMGRAAFGLARAEIQSGRLDDAERTARRFRRLADGFPRLRNTDDVMPDSATLDGLIALARGDTAGAHERFMAVLHSHGYFDGKRRKQLRPVALLVAQTALALGHPPDTVWRYAREAAGIATLDALTEIESARVGEARLIEARALLAAGDSVGAKTVSARAFRALRAGAGGEHPRTREAASVLQALGGLSSPIN